MRRLFVSLSAAVALGGCQSVPREAPPAVAAQAPAAPAPLRIEGKAIYLERIALPGARLEVVLIDDDAADDAASPNAAIAHAGFDELRGPPYAFALELDRALLREGKRYSLRAMLRDADGRLAFMTPARIALVPGQPLEFRLVRTPPL